MPLPKSATPPFLEAARAFYGEAFDHKKKRELAGAMAEWSELGEDEQTFTVAHLMYLNLQAQASTQRLLVQVRDLLDELAEAFTSAVEASLPDESDSDRDEEVEIEEVAAPAAPSADVIDAASIGPDGQVAP